MTIVEGVGWVLLHFVWQGAVIALALAVLLALTGDGQARLRYALSCSALAMMLAATVATAVAQERGNARPFAQTGGATMTPHPAVPRSEAPTVESPAAGTPAIAIPTAGVNRTSDGTPGWIRSMAGRLMPWLVLGWLAGVVILSLRLLGGWWTSRAIRRVGISAAPDWCRAQLIALSERMRVARPVAIVSSARISVPVIVGHLKPVIVLPAAALSGLSTPQVEAILAHELAHVRRHDYLVNLAQTVIETLLFYHPAVWWVSRQVREAREHCCDDLAVSVCRSRREYVSALLDLEELRGSTPALALGATDGSLLARGRRLLAPSQRPSSPRLAGSVIALTVVAAAVAGASFNAASIPTWSEPHPSPSPAPANAPDTATSLQPQAPGTTAVVVAPDIAAPLATRWSWAEGAARSAGRRAYWIGYSVVPVRTLPAVIYRHRDMTIFSDNITFSGQILSTDARNMRFPGRSLAIPGGQDRAVKLLFEIAAGRGQVPVAVHISTLSLPADTRDLPIFWLGPVEAAQSLERIDSFYRAGSTTELKHDLVSAAGVHDASAAVVAWLERRIASQDPDEIRGDAAEWMAYHPIAASVAALDRTARGDRSSHVRQEAAEALGDLAMPEAVPVLIDLARSLTDHDARREAVEALGARREPAAAEALAAIARQDKDSDIQREAVETLGDFEDKRGIGSLIELARSHPDLDVRREAIETLGDAMGGLGVPVLKELLGDRDPQIQIEAVEAIASIDQAAGLETLMELARSHASLDVRREAVEALGQQGENKAGADRQAILDLLTKIASSDRDSEVQIEAIETLGEIGGTAAVAELRKLASTHPDERARVEAVETLGESDAPARETAEFLKRLALAEKSADVQNEVLETLVDLRGGAGISALIELAREHPNQDTRKEALQRLLDSDHPEARALFERALKK